MEGLRCHPFPTACPCAPTCGDIRGRTPDGRLSVCYCQGVVCNWCGARLRRPITDHYDPRDGGHWLHTPYFALGGHRCPPGTERGTGKWYTVLPIVEQDLLEYRERMTQLAYDQMYHVPPRRTREPH